MIYAFTRLGLGSKFRLLRSAAALPAALVLGFFLAAPAAYGAEPPKATQVSASALQSLIAAAQKDGVLNMFGSGSWYAHKLVSRLEKDLNKTYGIKVRLKVSPGPSASKMLHRLIDEYKTGRKASSDIFLAPARQQIPMTQAGALRCGNWKKLIPDLTDQEIGLNGCSIVVGASIHIIGYNTNLVKAKDLPRTYKDFTNPKYKGKIGTTIYGIGWIEAAIHLGEKEATRIVNKMVANGTIIGTTRTGVHNRVATGEFPIFAFDSQPASYLRLKAKGAPVDYATLDDFMSGTASSVSVPKHSAHPNLAKLLAVYMLTKKAQKTIWKTVARDSPFRKGSNLHKIVEKKRATGAKIYFATDAMVLKNQRYYKKIGRKLSKKLRGG
jgi:iron(III) transport system substrate-binding protein